MNSVSNGHNPGSAAGVAPPPAEFKQKPAPRAPVTPPQPQSLPLSSDGSESRVNFHSDGVWLRGIPLRLARQAAIFELYNPLATPQVSEALGGFEIVRHEKKIYAGRATVGKILDAGNKFVCEVVLDENSWKAPLDETQDLEAGFKKFISEWQKSFHVLPEYKLVIADALTFLGDLKLWLDQIESGIRAAAPAEQAALENSALTRLRAPVIRSLNSLFERFEILSQKISEDLQATHRAYGQRLLHPYLLCAPFINRCYAKPLGYAGDFEMMNMIVRNGFEGGSLYAKLVNAYLLDQAPAHAVRGRVNFLNAKIIAETGRLARQGKVADIFCIACGPAWEASSFIAEHPLAEHARFTLLDFDETTLQHTAQKIERIRKMGGARTPVAFVKNSVQNLLRAASRETKPAPQYDLIYCSGLYDYLNDSVCASLNSHLYDLLRPGGSLIVGNFAPSTPIQNFMGHFLEWFLIYRTADELLALAPKHSAPDDRAIRSEASGTNFFLEVRRPEG